MSTDRDVIRIVESWLEEGVTALPDRVLDSVLDQVPATPQRRARWPAWRLNTMTTPIRIAAVVAAISALAVVGGLVPRITGPGTPDHPGEPVAQPVSGSVRRTRASRTRRIPGPSRVRPMDGDRP